MKQDRQIELYDWRQDRMVEVLLDHSDDFLKIKETLTRIGITSNKTRTLFQSCHILHKRGKYYIIHFKEAFLLENRRSNLSIDDIMRRNRIISLLQEWNLCIVVNQTLILDQVPINAIKIVPYKEKSQWQIIQKFQLGKK